MYVLTADYQKANASDVFVESLIKTGFGVIKNHPINYGLVKEVYALWADFFATSEKEKEKFLYDEKHDGFFPQTTSEVAKGYSVKDIKEYYHFYPWGRCPEFLREKTLQLYTELSCVAETLLGWIETHTPTEIQQKFSMPLSEMIHNSPRSLLRILHYPPLRGDEEEGAERAASHEDIDLLTVLPAATATGLQVKDASGKWHDIQSDPGTLIINAGDMLQECSDHYYKSTTHRVINPIGESAKQSRYSMPLFLHPRDDVKLSEKHTRESYWRERMQEVGVLPQ